MTPEKTTDAVLARDARQAARGAAHRIIEQATWLYANLQADPHTPEAIESWKDNAEVIRGALGRLDSYLAGMK